MSLSSRREVRDLDRLPNVELDRSYRAEGARELEDLCVWADELPESIDGRPVIGYAGYVADVARACLEEGSLEEARRLTERAFSLLYRRSQPDQYPDGGRSGWSDARIASTRAEIAAQMAPLFESLGLFAELDACIRTIAAQRQATRRVLLPATGVEMDDRQFRENRLRDLHLKMDEAVLRVAASDPAGDEQIRDILAVTDQLISDQDAALLDVRAIRLLQPLPSAKPLQEEVLGAFYGRLRLLAVSDRIERIRWVMPTLRDAAPERLREEVLTCLDGIQTSQDSDACPKAVLAYLAAEVGCFREARTLIQRAIRRTVDTLEPSDVVMVRDGHQVMSEQAEARLSSVMEHATRVAAAFARVGEYDDADALQVYASELWTKRLLAGTEGVFRARVLFQAEMGEVEESVRYALEGKAYQPHIRHDALKGVVRAALRKRSFHDADLAFAAIRHDADRPAPYVIDHTLQLEIAQAKMHA